MLDDRQVDRCTEPAQTLSENDAEGTPMHMSVWPPLGSHWRLPAEVHLLQELLPPLGLHLLPLAELLGRRQEVLIGSVLHVHVTRQDESAFAIREGREQGGGGR